MRVSAQDKKGVRVHNGQDRRRLPDGFLGALAKCGEEVLGCIGGRYLARVTLPRVVDVSLIDDAEIGRVHAQFMDNPSPTDVITFPYGEEGEVLISVETAERQALLFGASFEQEMVRYLVHGLLHLAGYDDLTPEGSAEMEEVQEALVAEAFAEGRSFAGR